MKIKFNWGTGIVIGIVCFMVFILQYVIRVQLDARYDNELVTENYYQKEVEVNSNRIKQEKAGELGAELKVETSDKGIEVFFPKDFNYEKIQGEISLYRPSNQDLDQTFPLKMSSNYLLIPKSRLVDGRWDITLNFDYEGNEYQVQKTLILK